MSVARTELRKARKQHQCSEKSYHVIGPGDTYLFTVAPPWHDMNTSKKWWVIRACLRCANEFGLHTSDTRKQLEAINVTRSQPTPEANRRTTGVGETAVGLHTGETTDAE